MDKPALHPGPALILGRPSANAGVLVRVLEDWRLASVAAFRDRVPRVIDCVASRYGLVLREGPVRSVGAEVEAIGTGPRRWMFVCRKHDEKFAAGIAQSLAGLAAVCDHSDGYAVFEVSGPCARRALAKGTALDLHPRSFTVADAAVTSIAQIGAMFWQVDDRPAYVIAVFRSYAASFVDFLRAGAAEFGVSVG